MYKGRGIPMAYKIYDADVIWSDEDDCWVGRVWGHNITFHGKFYEEAEMAFREAIDFYLETGGEDRTDTPTVPE